MNREIKFRAWDKVQNKMYYSTEQSDDGFFIIDKTGVRFGYMDWNEDRPGGNQYKETKYPESVIEQFTGLHDKNGKEIYEGDIVSLDSFSPREYEVKFIDGAFCLWNDAVNYATDIHYTHHADRNQSLIIGNIHETPELLEGGNK